jgi:hypothetical protein
MFGDRESHFADGVTFERQQSIFSSSLPIHLPPKMTVLKIAAIVSGFWVPGQFALQCR